MSTSSIIALPLGFYEWLPVSQAVTLGLFTFVQEDLPTVASALLAAAGTLGWQTGFWGCFLGIWIGDALLYLLARGFGRPLLTQAWARRLIDPASVIRSEKWFAAKGSWLLVSSRFVPGTRLPTYLAAGFLRLHFGRFLLLTGCAVAVWTIGIFVLANQFGPQLLHWLDQWKTGGWTILAATALVLGLIWLTRKSLQKNTRRRLAATCGRALRWEFWPAWLFYAPVVVNYIWLAVRYRGLAVPTAANPGIFSGGMVGESKMATLGDLSKTSPAFTADAYLLEGTTLSDRLASLQSSRERYGIDFPFILKPDLGQRGVGVQLIRTPEQAAMYLTSNEEGVILQRYAPGPHEVGIFYIRHPHETVGRIFAITEKVFPVLTGDGVHTIEELVWADLRARFMADKYLNRLNQRRSEVLAQGETIKLVEAGNHAQGCIFRDGMHLWSKELETRIDLISRQVRGFYVGRYDIRYSSAEKLREGLDFSIIELNGASSEATSIYDARNSLFSAYKTLFLQWQIVFAIGAANRDLGVATTPLRLIWRKWRESSALAASYPPTD